MEQPSTDLFSSELKFDETAKGHIRSMASWMMIIVTAAVVGYLVSVIQFLSPQEQLVAPEGFAETWLTGKTTLGQLIFTIAFGLLLNYFLFRFAQGSRKAINARDQSEMAASFRNLKIYFIITCFVLILVAIGLFIAFFAVLR
jgi:hypothetical protein